MKCEVARRLIRLWRCFLDRTQATSGHSSGTRSSLSCLPSPRESVREVQSTPLVCFRLSKTSTIPPSLCLPSYSMLNHAMCSMYCILPSSTHCTSRTSQEEDPCLFVAGRDSVSRHLFIGLVSIGFQLFVDISHANM
jgi:hypothetical protein